MMRSIVLFDFVSINKKMIGFLIFQILRLMMSAESQCFKLTVEVNSGIVQYGTWCYGLDCTLHTYCVFGLSHARRYISSLRYW